MGHVKKGERYQHYKGAFYVVDATALHTETEETMVVYHREEDPSRLFARPLLMFISDVPLGGKTVPRFRKVPPRKKTKEKTGDVCRELARYSLQTGITDTEGLVQYLKQEHPDAMQKDSDYYEFVKYVYSADYEAYKREVAE